MADDNAKYFEWQCPPQAAADSYKIGWANEIVEDGQSWLKGQRGYGDFRKAMDVLSGRDSRRESASYRSQVNPNRLKRDTREVIGALAKLRPMWGYHSDNRAYARSAEMFNKVTKAWYLEAAADLSVLEALQYAAATCRGWIHPIYSRDMFGTGRGDIHLETYGSPSVLPFQLPANGNFQSAYAVTILKEIPVAMAHGMFPLKQHLLRPSNSRYWYANDNIRAASQGNWLNRAFGKVRRTSGDTSGSDLLVPIRYQYIIDLAVNSTSSAIPMGEPGSSWSYVVPFIGQDIPTGADLTSGQMTYRKATENDARLYPQRRLIISTDKDALYDGPAFDWHGMFPGLSFCLDSYPWEPLGFSLIHEGFELNEAIKEIVRGDMDKIKSSLDMSLAFDTNAVSMKEARAFDPMQPRNRIGFDGSAIDGLPFQPVVPPEVLKVTPESMAMIQYLEGAMDNQLGVRDAMALAQMRAVGSMDELEKIVEANGPIIESISRQMEPPMRDLGNMVKYLIMQYYTTPRIMQVVGADNISPEIIDYDPSSLVPSHAPGESPDNPSKLTARQRARTFADNLRFLILPNSLHEMSQMVMKLGLIQLKKAGVKISSQTLAESWNVPNYGSFDGNTEIERWQSEQEMDLANMARAKELASALGLTPPPGAPAPGKSGPEGRPPSGNAAPALKSKDGGSRSTITESK